MAFCAWCANPVPEVSYAPCPRCGNPTNGAQRTGAAPKGSNTALIVILVVVGFFVIVAIAGILAAIAVPNFMTAKERAMQKRTSADLRMLAAATEAYATDYNKYPAARSVTELEGLIAPTYLKVVPKDGWGADFRYECWPENPCQQYAFASGGRDKHFEHDSLQDYPKGATTNFDCDIVFSNGSFIQYPEGLNVPQGGER